MIKIKFFSKRIRKEYAKMIAANVIKRNGNKNRITFIPKFVTRKKAPYTISVYKLLTLKRDKLIQIDGIKLYMHICSSQKYRSMSNVELLDSLHLDFPNQIRVICHSNGNYKYVLNGVNYSTTRKDDIKAHSIIQEAVSLIKGEFDRYDIDYSNYYFQNFSITKIDDLKKILKKMFIDLCNCLTGCTKNKNGMSLPIIDYSIISSDLRHKLMNSIGIRTCPYCNRNYITRYGINGSKSTADLDHFYQKEQYPLFALSLFNFIPSCPICNSRMKNTHPADDTIYPYEEGFEDDVHFELNYIGNNTKGEKILHLWQALSSIQYSDFEISLIIDPATPPDRVLRINKSKELFHLEEVYEDHKQDAMETALRTRIYCEGSYKHFCEKLFDKCKTAGMIYSSVSDLENYMFRQGFDNEWLIFGIFSNDEKRKFDKPLSKMIYDISQSKD